MALSPERHPPAALLAAIEAGLNRALVRDPGAAARIAELAGRVVGFTLEPIGLAGHLRIGNDSVAVLAGRAATHDAELRATPRALVRLLRGDAPAAAGADLRGNARLIERLAGILRALDTDPGGLLSRFLGPALAGPVDRGLRSLRGFSRDAIGGFRADLGDYLQYESRAVVTADELAAFANDVDQLRADVDRLAARVEIAARRGEAAP